MPGAVSRWSSGKTLEWEPLRPELVAEVAYDAMEGDRFRHTARFVRWRPDRDPRSCDYGQLEQPVRFDVDLVLVAGSNVWGVHRILAILFTTALLVSGCSLFDRDPDGRRTEVTWRPCPEVPQELIGAAAPHMTYECATVPVPQDWADPAGSDTFDIALIRIRSDQQRDRIGSLVLNPGGPGASGIDTAVYLSFGPLFGGLPDEVTRRFDIVGFDPRGVSRSSPIRCSTDEEMDASFGADPDPADERQFEQALADSRRIAQRCQDRYGEALHYLSTEQTARDLEAVREAVGDEKLTYLGYWYGTLLGAVYAHLFPDQVRAMVLDGAVDPAEEALASSEGQAAGFERRSTTSPTGAPTLPGVSVGTGRPGRGGGGAGSGPHRARARRGRPGGRRRVGVLGGGLHPLHPRPVAGVGRRYRPVQPR